jgi:hypothetical protein
VELFTSVYGSLTCGDPGWRPVFAAWPAACHCPGPHDHSRVLRLPLRLYSVQDAIRGQFHRAACAVTHSYVRSPASGLACAIVEPPILISPGSVMKNSLTLRVQCGASAAAQRPRRATAVLVHAQKPQAVAAARTLPKPARERVVNRTHQLERPQLFDSAPRRQQPPSCDGLCGRADQSRNPPATD